MTTTADSRIQLETIEADVLDEVAIAVAAADYARRLAGMTEQVEARRAAAQARFDAHGLPRGLAS